MSVAVSSGMDFGVFLPIVLNRVDKMPRAQQFDVVLPDGATLTCHVVGQGAPVLWISGLGGTAGFWDSIHPGLDGVMSITFDQRGLQKSKRGSDQVSIDRLALDAIAILDHMKLDQAHVVGHSTGGCIAMSMALADPKRVSSLVLSGSWANPNPYMQALFKWRLRMLDADPNLYQASLPFLSSTPQWLTDHPHQLTVSTNDWSPAQITVVRERIAALMAFDRRRDVAQLEMPCLVVGARDDIIVPVFLQEDLANLIPNARTHFFEHGGHFFPKSQSARFNSLLVQWLSQRKDR